MAILYKIESDFEALIPKFMEKRKKDVTDLEKAVTDSDFEEVISIGHKLKGNAGTYGFDALSEIGANLENAGKAQNVDDIKKYVEEFKDHFSQIEIEFV